jgi:type VI secretion system protein ImpM
MLPQAGFTDSVRQMLLALGMLLQPMLASGSNWLEKSLVLPLPTDPMYRNLVVALWRHLITSIPTRADVELALFVTRIQGKPSLVIGFCGASAQTLQAIMQASICLVQENLSVKSARDAIHAAFIGT